MRTSVLVWIFTGLLLQQCAHKRHSSKSVDGTQNTSGIQRAQEASANIASTNVSTQKGARRAEVLFLGHKSKHHDANKYAPWLAITLFKKGVNLSYTTDLNDLNTANLNRYDGLIIYANHDTISSAQETALKAFVEGGKGLIPLHSATGCFRNSEWYVSTVGGQFKSHKTGTFAAKILNASHPVTQGLPAFETFDETYVHQKLNPDMTILTARVEGDSSEPYTWVRNQGKGRVFYTAYGHDDSTWNNPGFQRLVSNGVLWALGEDVRQQIANLKIPDVDIYESSNIHIANYTKRHLVPKMQEALSPKESAKLMQVPVDFEVKLFAGEPDITNPIAMAWDEKGRLWIVESVDYPNTFLETDGAANDRIKICEDTNGDGMADKFTIFADKLNIPTSMVFANGGVIVSMAPHFVFLKDTNGDDKADVRENIMTGWEKFDTHFGPSNLQYGFNNKIWGVVGSGFNGATKDGKNLNFARGVYNLNPDGTGVEFLANTSNNTWGLGFSEDNNVFISTANNTHSAWYSMPAKYAQRPLPGTTVLPVQKLDGHYDSHTLTPNLRQVDVVGGFTSAAGHHMYTARNFPKEYWNRVAFVTEPTVRLVHNAVIDPSGAGFTEKDGWNLLASSDEWVGPVYAEVGPDGAVWIADWYNFIIQHNVFVERQAPSEMVLPFKEQPRGQGNAFISPLRDIDFGRIYKVVYKKGKAYKPLTLSKDDMPGLLAALENDNMFWRMTAQRLLVESKNQAAIPGLIKIISNQKVDEIGLNSPAVHALWTLHGIGALRGSNAEAMQVAVKALSHPAAGVRKAAIEVLPKNAQVSSIFQQTGLINDPNLNVRMTAIVAMAGLPPSMELGKSVYTASLVAENAKDEWLSRALLAAAITHEDGYTAAASTEKKSPEGTTEEPLSVRITKAISQEIYPLQRRGGSSFPPDVTGKEIIVKATISKQDTANLQGLIMAQGGSEGGYGLYIQNGKLNMVVKQGNKTYKATTTTPLPERFELMAKLSKNGVMTMDIDGKPVAKGKAVSLFTEPLSMGLRSGFDVNNENRMGDYTGGFPFTGNFQNATLELKKVKK